MSVMEKVRNYVRGFFAGPKEPPVDLENVGLVDVYLEKAFRILFWQSTERTLRVFFILNTLFWLLLMMNIRFYGALSLLSLIAFVTDILWRESLYKEYTGEYSSIVRELRNGADTMFTTLYDLRKSSPVVFYPLVSLFFLILHMVAKSAPGELFVYLLLLSTFFLPIGFQFLPESVASKIRALTKTITAPKCVLAEYELIPFIQGKDLSKRDADLESLLTDRTADSVTNSLVSGITSMPSYLEVAGAPVDIQEEDLLPGSAKDLAATPGELSSDSDSDNREIKFDSDHFNTSSSEDDPYSKDLTFPSNVELTLRENIRGGSMFQSVMNTVGGNIVASMFQSSLFGRAPPQTLRGDSDSDFEIVDAEEVEEESRSRGDN